MRAQLGTKSTVVDAMLGPISKKRRRDDDTDGNEKEEKDGHKARLNSGARTFKPFSMCGNGRIGKPWKL